MYAGPDAAPVGYCTDGDDVDMKLGGACTALCETLVYGTLEGVKISLGESEDVLWFDRLDGGGEEHGEITLNLGDVLAGREIIWIGVIEGDGRGKIAC